MKNLDLFVIISVSYNYYVFSIIPAGYGTYPPPWTDTFFLLQGYNAFFNGKFCQSGHIENA